MKPLPIANDDETASQEIVEEDEVATQLDDDATQLDDVVIPITPEEINMWIQLLINSVLQNNQLSAWHYKEIIEKIHSPIITIFRALPNIFEIGGTPQLRVFGDTHGQEVVAKYFEKSTSSSTQESQEIFMGDMIDRGEFSLENILLLCLWKLKNPQYGHILRGNHEDMNLSHIHI